MFALAVAPEAAQAAPAQANPIMSFLPLIFIFVIFYFLLIRPQQKAQKDHAKMIASLAKNDEVVTSGGIFGTIINIQDDIITLRVDDNVKIRVQKGSVARLKKAETK